MSNSSSQDNGSASFVSGHRSSVCLLMMGGGTCIFQTCGMHTCHISKILKMMIDFVYVIKLSIYIYIFRSKLFYLFIVVESVRIDLA